VKKLDEAIHGQTTQLRRTQRHGLMPWLLALLLSAVSAAPRVTFPAPLRQAILVALVAS